MPLSAHPALASACFVPLQVAVEAMGSREELDFERLQVQYDMRQTFAGGQTSCAG